MTRAIALMLGVALATAGLGCGKYGAPVRYRPVPADEAQAADGGAATAPGQRPAKGDEEAPPATTPPPAPAEPRDPTLEPAPGWQP